VVAISRVSVLKYWHRLGYNVVALAPRASISSLGEADRWDGLDLNALGFVLLAMLAGEGRLAELKGSDRVA